MSETLIHYETQRNQIFLLHLQNPQDPEIKSLLEALDQSIALEKEIIALGQEEAQKQIEEGKINDILAINDLKPGDLCQGIYQNEWYNAKVESIEKKDGQTIHSVKYFGFPDIIGKLTKEKIRIYKPQPTSSFKIGDKCLAVYNKDNKYYNGTIDQIKDNCVVIKFSTYNNYQETPVEHVHPYLYDQDGKRVGSKKLKKQAALQRDEKKSEESVKSWKDFQSKMKNPGLPKRKSEELDQGKFVPLKKTK
jgi:hypothetical protein